MFGRLQEASTVILVSVQAGARLVLCVEERPVNGNAGRPEKD